MVVVPRNRLNAEVISICRALRLWYQADVVKETEVDLRPVDISDDEDSDSDNENGGARLLYNSDGWATSGDSE
jgi:hypothetical protein